MNNTEANIIRKYCMIENESISIGNKLQKFIEFINEDISEDELVKLLEAKQLLTNLHFKYGSHKAMEVIKNAS